MFFLSFMYYGCDVKLYDCWGISFSPARRIMYVKRLKNGKRVTESYYYDDVFNLTGTLYINK